MRSKSMQSLTDAWKRRHPGVVIYGIGDAAHKLRTSDHNEDDTAGSRAEQSDADSNPEHRALDGMLGPNFTKAEAYAFIADLLADPAALKRLRYIIFDGWIWSKSHGWVKRAFDGDPHDDHVHASGDAADDENAAGWPAVDGTGEDMADLDYGNSTWKPANPKVVGSRPARLLIDEIWMELHGGYDGAYDTTPSPRGGLLPRMDRLETAMEAVLVAVRGEADTATILAGVDERLANQRQQLRAELVPAIVAALPPGSTADADTVEEALRRVLGGVDGATPPTE